MQNLIGIVLLGAVATGASIAKPGPGKVEKTMTVNRCQAVLKDGSQCGRQADEGRNYCWQHRTVKAVNMTVKGAGDGGRKAWESTKSWSTNAWEATKSGWNKAVDATKDSFDGARVGVVELFGGKDAKGK